VKVILRSCVLVIITILISVSALFGQAPTRLPSEDVNSQSLRTRQHLKPDASLLFNGLGLSPAGQHVRISDMPLKMLVAPDRKAVVAVCAGYNEAGVNLVSLDERRERQFISLPEAFNGLVFSEDGKRFYVTGGDSGAIYVFRYAKGKADLEKTVHPGGDQRTVFLAGLAIESATRKLYVCNEANHEVWQLAADSLKLERTIPVGQHPHSCILGADSKH
jgi:DNA-binding beta-propeller fold protein YncE